MNVQLGRGKVHYSTTPEGFMPGPDCGGNRAAEGYRKVTGEVTCKNCLKIIAAEAAEAAEVAETEETQEVTSVENVISFNGGKVHTMMPGQEEHPYPLCRGGGQNQMLTKFTTTSAPLTCKTCQGYADRRAARIAAETASTNQGETMTDRNDVTTDQGQKVVEQIDANVERALSLTDAEALTELEKETEALISTLSGKGSIAIKTEKRAAFKTAADTMPEDVSTEPTAKGVVSATDPKDYSIYAGVTELIADGAARVSEGVNLHLKTSDLAKDVASIMLDMWHRIPNKDGNPDILGTSHAAKEAARALYAKAGENFERTYETEEALKKLQRAVQHQRSDVRAQYLRSLDNDPEEQQRYAKALEAMPEGVTISEYIAGLYGTALKGHGEIQRERYHAKAALTSGADNGSSESESDDEGDDTESKSAESPDVRVRSFVQKLKRDVIKAKPEDFEKATEETKESVRAELEDLYKAVKKMIDATF